MLSMILAYIKESILISSPNTWDSERTKTCCPGHAPRKWWHLDLNSGPSKLHALLLQWVLLVGGSVCLKAVCVMPSGVSLRTQPRYSDVLPTKAPSRLQAFRLGLLHLVPSLCSSRLSSGSQGRFLVLMMPLDIQRVPCPPEDQGASNPLVRRGAGARAQLGPGWGGSPRRGECASSLDAETRRYV